MWASMPSSERFFSFDVFDIDYVEVFLKFGEVFIVLWVCLV